MKKVTALLPMKGHSERVPNKNIRQFAGRPLYHCIGKVLQMSKYVDSILLNTDSDVIAQDALEHFPKVKVIKRPKEICGDMVSMNLIIKHDLSIAENEHFLQTHSTNPLLSLESLNTAIEKYFEIIENGYDSLFTVTKNQTRMYWGSGEPVNHNPKELLRTQDLPPIFEENSNIYIFSKKAFEHAKHKRIGNKPFMFELNRIEAIDIDGMDDFFLAEILFNQKLKEK